MQVFGLEDNILKLAINMFENMEKSESIYEVIVEPYYKTKTNRAEATHSGHSRKMKVRDTPSKINP